MHLALVLALMAAAPSQNSTTPQKDPAGPVYTNYGEAYRAAQKAQRPLLVILNPGNIGANIQPVTLDEVRKTAERRELMKDYVVAVIDTGSRHGTAVHKVFNEPKLPRVVVIDKRQQFQIYQTSEPVYGQLWTQILTTYRTGEAPATPAQSAWYCPYCQ